MGKPSNVGEEQDENSLAGQAIVRFFGFGVRDKGNHKNGKQDNDR
ncbi:MAG: hypothetical protein DHS20C20_12700 [Ardenticatenaceae bacterium]|nr:MAG: hypothetical protein DHS20C20_12700 [Ardenticatenaceae bacterium]